MRVPLPRYFSSDLMNAMISISLQLAWSSVLCLSYRMRFLKVISHSGHVHTLRTPPDSLRCKNFLCRCMSRLLANVFSHRSHGQLRSLRCTISLCRLRANLLLSVLLQILQTNFCSSFLVCCNRRCRVTSMTGVRQMWHTLATPSWMELWCNRKLCSDE